MSQNTILLLQSIGITLQMVNGGLGVAIHNPVLSLVLGAVIGGFQFYVQHVGNQSVPPLQTDEPVRTAFREAK